MAEALRQILFEHELIFVDTIRLKDLDAADLVLIGGGSFLYAPIRYESKAAWGTLHDWKPVIYVGVGSETDIHSEHEKLLKKASAAFTRTQNSHPKWVAAAPTNTAILPDLTMCLKATPNALTNAKRLLYIPNAELVPARSAPAWKKPAWEYFKSEISQAFDELIADGWTITTAPFSAASGMRDQWAAFEVTAMCDKRWKVKSLDESWLTRTFEQITWEYNKHSVVLTQRFHGAVIAQVTQTPCVVVHHVDKLEQMYGCQKVSYYGVRKDLMLDAIKNAYRPVNPVVPATFAIVRDAVSFALSV